MASRSTRRRLKETEVSKLDEHSNQNEDIDSKEFETGRRKSLRHSPGTSVSPPHKTRRMMATPSGVENKSPKSSPNTSIHKLQSSPDHINDILLNSEKNSDSRISTRKSSRISSTSLMNSSTGRSLSISPSPSKVTTTPSTSPINPPRRSTRKKGITCDKSKTDDILKDKSLVVSNCQSPDHTKISILPSTSHGHKRNLSSSPELSDTDTSNGISTKLNFSDTKKAKYDVSVSNPFSENGKSCKVNLGKNISENICHALQQSSNILASASNKKEFVEHAEDKPVMVKINDKSDPKVLSKRIMPESPSESYTCNKKSKIDTSADDLPKISLSKNNDKERLSTNVNESSSLIVAQKEKMESTTTYSSSTLRLLLVDEFIFNQEQFDEIKSLVASIDEDATYVVIIETLIEKLLKDCPSIRTMSSPRFNKFLKQLITKYCSLDISIEKKHLICQDALEWSKERKSVNLRHELELASMILYYDTKFYRKAEEVATALYKETKKLQDKEKTVKACLCLSKAYHAMGNISKARANITTAKTEALKIYTPPDLQAELDLQSGIMQVAEEKDMETAFSYFKEAATGFTIKTLRSKALKYMLLTKLLINKPEEGEKAVKSQTHINDIDFGVEAMLSITKAATSCSLAEFKAARDKYAEELENDLVVRGVLEELYAKMLEKNLLNIIAPYERMQIGVVATKIGLMREEVERRLSQMILDGKISAQLDHRDDCLYVYEREKKDLTYENSIDTVSQLDKTLSLLSKKVKQLL